MRNHFLWKGIKVQCLSRGGRRMMSILLSRGLDIGVLDVAHLQSSVINCLLCCWWTQGNVVVCLIPMSIISPLHAAGRELQICYLAQHKLWKNMPPRLAGFVWKWMKMKEIASKIANPKNFMCVAIIKVSLLMDGQHYIVD